jgi:hypothetical protein
VTTKAFQVCNEWIDRKCPRGLVCIRNAETVAANKRLGHHTMAHYATRRMSGIHLF